MLTELAIVKGAVAKKDIAPVLTHLKISDGWLASANGRMSISVRLARDPGVSAIVPAELFLRAVNLCREPVFRITDSGRLAVTSKITKARVLLPNLNGDSDMFPADTVKNGSAIRSSDILSVLAKLYPFVGADASRPWGCGILVSDGGAAATNNTVLARCKIDWNGPPINLPDFLVTELLRLKKDILSITFDSAKITFRLTDDIWITSSTLSAEWPDLEALFSSVDFTALQPVPTTLAQDIHSIVHFCPDKKFPRVHFSGDGISTDPGQSEAQISTAVLPDSVWRAEPILQMLEHTNKNNLCADFSQWPKPCPWKTDNGITGLIIGLRE